MGSPVKTAIDYLYCLCGTVLQVTLDDPGDDVREYAVCVTPADELAEDESEGTFVSLVGWWARRHAGSLCRPCNAEEYHKREAELSLLDSLWALDSSCPPG